MTALAPIADKLTRLIPRLASDHDREVVATVRAIQRTLAAQKLDLHDLAHSLAPKPVPVFDDAPPPSNNGWRPTFDPDWREMAEYCRRHLGRLSAREQDFVRTISRDWRGMPTERQFQWLQAIHRRLKRRR